MAAENDDTNAKRIWESERKAPRCVICPLLHSAPRNIHTYTLPTTQFIDTLCYWEQKSFWLSKYPFFSAVLDFHRAQVLAMLPGKPCDIKHSWLHPKPFSVQCKVLYRQAVKVVIFIEHMLATTVFHKIIEDLGHHDRLPWLH